MSDTDFMKNEAQLMQRVSIVSSGLSSLGLSVRTVGTEEVVGLYYKLFNPSELNSPTQNTK
jgi:hypothetical protein